MKTMGMPSHSNPAEVPTQQTDAPSDYLDTVMGTTAEMNGQNHSSDNGASLPEQKSGILGASSNLVNSIVGAGIIGIPYALGQSGLVTGVFLLILVAWLTDNSLRIIVELASFHPKLKGRGVMSYEDLMSYPFGRVGSAFILFNMFVMAYGAMVAYMLIIKDTVPTILGFGEGMRGGIEREIIMVATTLIIILPLAMQRDMATLAFTSLLSISADAVLVVFVIIYAPMKETISNAGGFGQVLKDEWLNPTLFIGLGILSTAMACQHSAFIVSGSLENKTIARWSTVTFQSISFSALLCLLLGVCGYLGYLEETQGDVLNNFPPDSMESNAARGLLAVTMFFTYPMESLVARHVVCKLLYSGNIDGEVDEQGNIRPAFLCLGRRHLVTLVLYIMSLIPALIVDDLGPVLSITGSLGGSCISYMAPGMVYLGVNGEDFLKYVGQILENHRQKKGKNGTTGDIELPVAGNADEIMRTKEIVYDPHGSKPLWWFPLLMPIWVSLASSGHLSMKERIEEEEAKRFRDMGDPTISDRPPPSSDEDDGDAVSEEFRPTTRGYIKAIFFIVFGVIGGVAGIGSNIYVQVNNIFFTPA